MVQGRIKGMDLEAITEVIEKEAKRLFATKGNTNVTVTDIMLATGYTEPTVCKRSGRKENFFLSLALSFWRRLNYDVSFLINKDNPADRMFQLLLLVQKDWHGNKKEDFYLPIIGLQAMSFQLPKRADRDAEEQFKLVKKEIEKFEEIAISIIKEGKENGDFRIATSSQVIWSLFWGGFCNFVQEHFKQLLSRKKGFSEKDKVDAISVLVRNFLVAK